MKIKVEQCYSGHENFHYRLTIPRTYGNARYNWRANEWTRKTSSDVLDMLKRVYGIDRRNVRFQHH